jgi:flagellar hook-length control protein FliK
MVVNAVRNGTQILTIQLYPPGLGQVVLRMAMDGQKLRLSTRAATSEGADALRNMEVDLRDALAGNGVNLAGFDVSEDGTHDEAPRREQAAPITKPSSGGAKESFTVDMNA